MFLGGRVETYKGISRAPANESRENGNQSDQTQPPDAALKEKNEAQQYQTYDYANYFIRTSDILLHKRPLRM